MFIKRLPFYRAIVDFVARRPGVALILAGLYLLSPFDLVPEALVGPLGYVDDFVLLVLALIPGILKRRRQPPIDQDP